MKKMSLLVFPALLVLFSSFSFAKKGGPAGTVEILHKPDDQAIIIRVNMNALEAHIRHGDCVFDGSDEPGEPDARKSDFDDLPYCEDEEPDA